jgi:hypothetical protein
MKIRILLISIIVMIFCISCTPGITGEIKNISESPIEICYTIHSNFLQEGVEQKISKILDSGEKMELYRPLSRLDETLNFSEYHKITTYVPLFEYFSVTFLNNNKTITLNDEEYFNITSRKEGVSSYFFTVEITDSEVSKN